MLETGSNPDGVSTIGALLIQHTSIRQVHKSHKSSFLRSVLSPTFLYFCRRMYLMQTRCSLWIAVHRCRDLLPVTLLVLHLAKEGSVVGSHLVVVSSATESSSRANQDPIGWIAKLLGVLSTTARRSVFPIISQTSATGQAVGRRRHTHSNHRTSQSLVQDPRELPSRVSAIIRQVRVAETPPPDFNDRHAATIVVVHTVRQLPRLITETHRLRRQRHKTFFSARIGHTKTGRERQTAAIFGASCQSSLGRPTRQDGVCSATRGPREPGRRFALTPEFHRFHVRTRSDSLSGVTKHEARWDATRRSRKRPTNILLVLVCIHRRQEIVGPESIQRLNFRKNRKRRRCF